MNKDQIDQTREELEECMYRLKAEEERHVKTIAHSNKLEAKLAISVEALTEIADATKHYRCLRTESDMATEALKKIKEME